MDTVLSRFLRTCYRHRLCLIKFTVGDNGIFISTCQYLILYMFFILEGTFMVLLKEEGGHHECPGTNTITIVARGIVRELSDGEGMSRSTASLQPLWRLQDQLQPARSEVRTPLLHLPTPKARRLADEGPTRTACRALSHLKQDQCGGHGGVYRRRLLFL